MKNHLKKHNYLTIDNIGTIRIAYTNSVPLYREDGTEIYIPPTVNLKFHYSKKLMTSLSKKHQADIVVKEFIESKEAVKEYTQWHYANQHSDNKKYKNKHKFNSVLKKVNTSNTPDSYAEAFASAESDTDEVIEVTEETRVPAVKQPEPRGPQESEPEPQEQEQELPWLS